LGGLGLGTAKRGGGKTTQLSSRLTLAKPYSHYYYDY